MAGIAWGVASIVLIVAMGDGFKLGQRDRFRQLGENIVIVFNGRTEKQAGGQRAGRRIRLDYDDVRDIRAECFLVKRVVAELQNRRARREPVQQRHRSRVMGVEPLYSEIRNIPVDRGRFLAGHRTIATRRGWRCWATTSASSCSANARLRRADTLAINGLPFRIVGLMPPKDPEQQLQRPGQRQDLHPVLHHGARPAAGRREFPPGHRQRPDLRAGLARPVRKRRATRCCACWPAITASSPTDPSAVRIWDTVENAQLVDNIFTSMTAFLGAIAVVTLTLGGVGVMNIMLVSVTERTREIGLRKAVGATRRRILVRFPAGRRAAGGAQRTLRLGWALTALAAAVNRCPSRRCSAACRSAGPTTALAFGALALIAVASALWPAWRAASLTPVEALRYER